MRKSELEESLTLQIRALKLPQPKREFRFCDRRWRLDFAWVDMLLAVEVHGGTYTNGRHVRGDGFAKDREKINTAQLLGWRVLEFDAKQVKDGTAIKVIEIALNVFSEDGESTQGTCA